MALLTQRTSTIFVAIGGETRVYRSVEEIPPALKRKLQNVTRGMNSATILIADKRGREELMRALEEQQRTTGASESATITSAEPAEKRQESKWTRFASLKTWLELLLPLAIGASLWVLIEWRF